MVSALNRRRAHSYAVLQVVQKQERTEPIRSGVLKKLDDNPELKKAYQTLVKNNLAECV